MKKIIFLLLYVLLTINNAVSQDELIWEKSFSGVYNISKSVISPDGSYIALGAEKLVYLLDNKGKVINQLDGNISTITDIIISYDGKNIYSGAGSEENMDYLPFILKWNSDQGIIESAFEPDNSNNSDNLYLVESMAVSSNGVYLAGLFKSQLKTGNDNDRLLYIWDLNSETILKIFNFPGDEPAKKIKFTPDNISLLVTKGRSIEIISLPEFTSTDILGNANDWHKNSVNDFSISSDGKFLATVGDDGFAKIWNLNTNSLISSLIPLNETSNLVNVEFGLNDEYLILTEASNKTLSIFDINNNVNVYNYNQFDNSPLSLGMTGDKKNILLSDSSNVYYFKANYENSSEIIDPDKFSESISIYPNPCQDEIFLETSLYINLQLNVQIFNSLNVKVLEWKLTSSAEGNKISLKYLASGFYYMIISNGQNKVFRKFIKTGDPVRTGEPVNR